ncbi:hypothetical protein K3495_g10139 [Podosphaera aphanis]|nr:hypothetical protein K3495_g10139 [Podosphaera aphanis]
MASSSSDEFEVAGMSLLNPSCLCLNKRINEMGENLDQVLAGVQRDISNLKADTTGIKAEISGLNSNLNGLTNKVSSLDNNISKLMSLETLLQAQVNVQSPIPQDNLLISGTKKEEIESVTPQMNQPQRFQTSLLEKMQARPERLPNGDINLQVPFRKPKGLTVQERKVIEDWPKAVLPSQAHLYGEPNHKNKINFKHDTKLSTANHKVLQTLGDIQDQLKLALIPYYLWPMKVTAIMDKDFKQVSVWAKESNVTWLDLVEGIIQDLKQHRSLYSPMTIFSKLTPHSGETKLEFSERIKDTFYRLPVQRRESLGVMEAFKDILQEHLPLVLLNLGDKVSSLSTASLVEETVLVIRLLDRHSKTQIEDQNSNGIMPIVADPRFDDRTVNIAKESNDKCFKCHRM